MYQSKEKSYGIIAIIYYCIYFLGLFLAGILHQKGITFGTNIIYCSLFAVGVLIALIKDRNINNLGFCFIAYKCKDITIPIAVHYTYDVLGVLL